MSEKRQDIIETAFRLFSENGFYATGIDLIISQSRVSKRTFYNHFESKDTLILAVLEHYRVNYFESLKVLISKCDNDPEKEIKKLFEIAYQCYGSQDFNGCLAISAMNEFGNKHEGITKACALFKKQMWDFLLDIVERLSPKNSRKITNKLFIMLEGMTATAHIGSVIPEKRDFDDLINTICAR